MSRTKLVIESKYFSYLTNEEIGYLSDRLKDKYFYQSKRDICIAGMLTEILKGRTAEEFVADLEDRMNTFNNKYSCDKNLSVRADSGRLFIKFAYNEQLKNELKKSLSAKWHADSKEWSVPLADEVAANEIIKKSLGKGFLKEEGVAEAKEKKAAETVEEINCTSEELKAKYNKIFMTDVYTIGLLLCDKFRKFTPCVIDGMGAHLYAFDDIALIDMGVYHGMCLKKFRTADTDVNKDYEEKAKMIYYDTKLSKDDRTAQIKDLLNRYLAVLNES